MGAMGITTSFPRAPWKRLVSGPESGFVGQAVRNLAKS